jgi:hypothetical protein
MEAASDPNDRFVRREELRLRKAIKVDRPTRDDQGELEERRSGGFALGASFG